MKRDESARNWTQEIQNKYNEETKGFQFKKRSFARNYLNKDKPLIIKEYKGKYGKGKTIEYQTDITNGYHRIEYWIEYQIF